MDDEKKVEERKRLEEAANRMLGMRRQRKSRAERGERVEGLVKAALSDEEVREGLKFTRADLDALNQSIHAPGRHAQAVQSGLKLKAMVNGLLEKVEGKGEGVSVVVNTLTYAPDPERTTASVIIRRKRKEEDDAEQE